MTNMKLTQEDLRIIRERMKYEDGLLNSRTDLVLTVNGLVAIAAVVDHTTNLWIFALIIVVIDFFWLWCSTEAWCFIHKLGSILKEKQYADSIPIDVRLHNKFTEHLLRIGATATLGFIMPLLLILGWITALVARY